MFVEYDTTGVEKRFPASVPLSPLPGLGNLVNRRQLRRYCQILSQEISRFVFGWYCDTFFPVPACDRENVDAPRKQQPPVFFQTGSSHIVSYSTCHYVSVSTPILQYTYIGELNKSGGLPGNSRRLFKKAALRRLWMKFRGIDEFKSVKQM